MNRNAFPTVGSKDVAVDGERARDIAKSETAERSGATYTRLLLVQLLLVTANSRGVPLLAKTPLRCCDGTHSGTARLKCARTQMVSGLAAVLRSCLWVFFWERVLLQPTSGGAFLVGGGGPTLLRQQHAVAVAGYATRSQHRRSRRRRKRGLGGESLTLNMNLGMTPGVPHPTKVAFQVRQEANHQRPKLPTTIVYACMTAETEVTTVVVVAPSKTSCDHSSFVGGWTAVYLLALPFFLACSRRLLCRYACICNCTPVKLWLASLLPPRQPPPPPTRQLHYGPRKETALLVWELRGRAFGCTSPACRCAPSAIEQKAGDYHRRLCT